MAIRVRDRRGGGWWWAHNAIVTEYGADLGTYGIAVYAALSCHAGEEGVTWIGQKNIAAEIGCSRAQVQKELAKPRTLGPVEIEEQANEHGQTTNTSAPLPVETPRLRDRQGGHTVGTMAPITKAAPDHQAGSHEDNKTQRTRPHDQGSWQADLRATMTSASHERWIQPLELVERANSHAVLQASTEQVADYVRRRLADRISEALGVERIEVRTGERG